ncbi:methylmalonyl Co-A mutase-associated GTPase MeaB [Phaeocystidibacter luteus]|uniref:methylmalonyl Co-A mutase-associated GTPase MeaB n=1 Tax=Phaeocystidibacter luteus TaxID=911197 RepID=UPI001676137C|nr:methylmalonyl Co-A mutase-associated GTPase MeaB [Phaeocystidibacter luteus]
MTKKPSKSALSEVPGVDAQASLNPNLKQRNIKRKQIDVESTLEKLLAGDRTALSQAITLVESTRPSDFPTADKLVQACLEHSGKSIRIGITGVPGVGKSTFVERFGLEWIEKNHKVAVLAVDPSSAKTGGSILGDKTRMNRLSQNENAFIRPSPSAGSLGGVARKTRETMILCEAAGYDIILVETVGVGQSETSVKRMVDLFALLLLPGAGDELQGIKRGIMEMADLILLNKADSGQERKAQLAAAEVRRALKLYPDDPRGWTIPVEPISAVEGTNIPEVIDEIEKFRRHMELKGHWHELRSSQALWWLDDTIGELLHSYWLQQGDNATRLSEVKAKVQSGEMSPLAGARRLFG